MHFLAMHFHSMYRRLYHVYIHTHIPAARFTHETASTTVATETAAPTKAVTTKAITTQAVTTKAVTTTGLRHRHAFVRALSMA